MAWPLNSVISLTPFGHYVLERSIGNRDFELLVLKSFNYRIPMILTLTNGKVYVNWAVRAPDPTEERKYLRILPLMSGYRSPTYHKAVFTTYYDDVYLELSEADSTDIDHLDIEDFEVVLPTDKVSSGHLFDVAAYSKFGNTN